jgi:hypothetical protein
VNWRIFLFSPNGKSQSLKISIILMEIEKAMIALKEGLQKILDKILGNPVSKVDIFPGEEIGFTDLRSQGIKGMGIFEKFRSDC